jgi:hypothetical protein
LDDVNNPSVSRPDAVDNTAVDPRGGLVADSSRDNRLDFCGGLAACTIAALVILRLVLVAGHPMSALATAAYDDGLYARLANSIYSGRWLGTYDQFTLIKGPGYPLFIAGCRCIGLPLPLAQHLLYVMFCMVAYIALAPAMPGRLSRVLLFATLLFNPMSFHTGAMSRVIREGIYPALSGLTVACAAGLLLRCGKPGGKLGPWAAGLGLSAAALWITREEGEWLAPTVILLLVACAVVMARSNGPSGWRQSAFWRRAAVLLMPVLLFAAVIGTICQLNAAYYGVFGIVELKSPSFVAAYASLARLKPERYQPYIVVSAKDRQKLYAVSPAFAELREALEGPIGRRWADADTIETHGQSGEIAAGWWIWALRDAAASCGYHTSAGTAAAFYDRIAGEVNAACDNGTLKAWRRHDSLAPRWRREYLWPVLEQLRHGIARLVNFRSFDPWIAASEGSDDELSRFWDLTDGHVASPVAPALQVQGWAVDPSTPTEPAHIQLLSRRGLPTSFSIQWMDSQDVYNLYHAHGLDIPVAKHARFMIRVPYTNTGTLVVGSANSTAMQVPLDVPRLVADTAAEAEVHGPQVSTEQLSFPTENIHPTNRIARVYIAAMPVLSAVGMVGFCLQWLALIRRRANLLLVITTGLMMAIAVRLLLLAYISATSWIDESVVKFSPLFPLLILFIGVSIVGAFQTWWPWPRPRITAGVTS